MLAVLISILALGLLLFVVVEFVVLYAQAGGSPWRRAIEATKGSATILWARFTMFLGAFSALLVEAAGYLGAPGIADTVKAILAPQYVGVFLVVVAVVSEFARRRTL